MKKLLVMLLMIVIDLSFGFSQAENAAPSALPNESSAAVISSEPAGQSAEAQADQTATQAIDINCSGKTNDTEMWKEIQTSLGDKKITSFDDLQTALTRITTPTTLTLTSCNMLPFSFETPEAGDTFREDLVNAINEAVAVNRNVNFMYW